MRRWSIGTVALGGAVCLVAVALGAAAEPKDEVNVRLFQFRPSPLVVSSGTRVTWHNGDDIEHTVTSGTPDTRDGRFAMPLAGKNARVTVEFTEPGVYPYFCDRHQSMRGEIRVNPPHAAR